MPSPYRGGSDRGLALRPTLTSTKASHWALKTAAGSKSRPKALSGKCAVCLVIDKKPVAARNPSYPHAIPN
jgi:hypothetical protein